MNHLTMEKDKTADRMPVNFAPAEVVREDLADGAFILRSPQDLALSVNDLSDYLDHWSVEAPDRAFLMERDQDDAWDGVTFGEAQSQMLALAAYLLEAGLGPDRPLLILSGNSVRHGVLMLAAMHVGIPVVPVSTAYSLLSEDLEKLRHITGLTRPGMAYAEDAAEFSHAFDYLAGEADVQLLARHTGDRQGVAAYDAALECSVGAAVDAAHAGVNLDTIAKILFTSGSTGMPKGVINTQRMMVANQQALAQVWPFLEEKPPVIVDWLPWNHTFGGNFNFNQILRNGGSLYIDDGKPVPGLMDKTIRNLRDVAPTLYFNVPKGFDMLAAALRDDAALRKTFFSRLDLIFYSGAALPEHLWRALEDLSVEECGVKVPFVSAWGATETAPMITCVHFPIPKAGVIGLPTPGYDVKFLPNGSRLEMRVKGPCVTPGYWNDAEKTREAFDAGGFYIIGDAGKFEDPEKPEKGIVFDGRTSENFKLTTGTWVSVGNLRIGAIEALGHVVSDLVITGHDRSQIGALVFLNPDGCRDLAGRDSNLADFAQNPVIRAHLAKALAGWNSKQTGSSTRIGRLLVLPDMPDMGANEITDKGYLNQRLLLERRADQVASLYDGGAAVILPEKKNDI